MQYSVEAAKGSSLLARCILSSDSEEIIEKGRKLGLEAPFIRPVELARDDTPSIAVIAHALRFLEEKGENFEAVCLLQPTTPFRSPGLIDRAIEKFRAQEVDSLISVREVPHEYNPHWVFEEKDGSLAIATGEKEIISRRQELPRAYHRDGAIYLTKTEIILKRNSLYGDRIGFIANEDPHYVNLDTQADWERAEEILKNKS